MMLSMFSGMKIGPRRESDFEEQVNAIGSLGMAPAANYTAELYATNLEPESIVYFKANVTNEGNKYSTHIN